MALSSQLGYLSLTMLIVMSYQFALLKPSVRPHQGGSCPISPRPLNSSVKDAWESTKKIEALVTEHYGKKDFCIKISRKPTTKDMGIKLMESLFTIRCYAISKTEPFSKTEAIMMFNDMTLSISEIVVNPLVCIQNTDEQPFSCADEIDINDKEALQKTLVYQKYWLSALNLATFQ